MHCRRWNPYSWNLLCTCHTPYPLLWFWRDLFLMKLPIDLELYVTFWSDRFAVYQFLFLKLKTRFQPVFLEHRQYHNMALDCLAVANCIQTLPKNLHSKNCSIIGPPKHADWQWFFKQNFNQKSQGEFFFIKGSFIVLYLAKGYSTDFTLYPLVTMPSSI